MMAFVMVRLRVGLENWNPGLCCLIPTVIGTISAVGLLLAALHGIEATIWAVVYLWLGAVGSFTDAMLYSVNSITTAELRAGAAPALANAGCAGGSRRHAAVWHQHSLYVCSNAGVLADALPSSLARWQWRLTDELALATFAPIVSISGLGRPTIR